MAFSGSGSTRWFLDSTLERIRAKRTKSAEYMETAQESLRATTEAGALKTREVYDNAAEKAYDLVDEHPLRLVAGGLVAGIVLGAILPKTKQETELLSDTVDIIGDTLGKVADAAIDVMSKSE